MPRSGLKNQCREDSDPPPMTCPRKRNTCRERHTPPHFNLVCLLVHRKQKRAGLPIKNESNTTPGEKHKKIISAKSHQNINHPYFWRASTPNQWEYQTNMEKTIPETETKYPQKRSICNDLYNHRHPTSTHRNHISQQNKLCHTPPQYKKIRQ